jgi:integrase
MLALALRPGEARTIRFDWIDETASTITLPMTKNGKPFVAPINDAASEVIDRAVKLRTSEYMFPGRDSRSPIGERSIYTLISQMTGASAHGVARSCFADYCYDNLQQFSESTIEAALHHSIGDLTVRAYRRGDALEPRRKLMAAWSDFITGRVALDDGANIVQFPRTAAT